MGKIRQLTQTTRHGVLSVDLTEDSAKYLSGKPSINTELFLRKTFEQDAGEGISLLFRQYYALLCSHAVRYVSSKAIAEDIVSDIFYEFQIDKRHQTINSSYRAYLFTMVRNRAFDYIKNELRNTISLEKAELIPSNITQWPDSITQYEELHQDVQNAINTMPLKRRQVYVMHRFEDKKAHEIAAELDLSLRTIEAHLYQAIRQIRTSLKDKWLIIVYVIAPFWW